MPSYIVTWEIDADEVASPAAAARYARAAQIRRGTIATVFVVQDKATGERVQIDLTPEHA
jgi:hypothetical protein